MTSDDIKQINEASRAVKRDGMRSDDIKQINEASRAVKRERGMVSYDI